MEISDLTSHREVVRARRLADPVYAAEADRLELADAVSVAVVLYRVENDLSAVEFGRAVGLTEATVLRLEQGDQKPSTIQFEHLKAAGVFPPTDVDKTSVDLDSRT